MVKFDNFSGGGSQIRKIYKETNPSRTTTCRLSMPVLSKLYSLAGALTGVFSGILNILFNRRSKAVVDTPVQENIKRLSDRFDTIFSRLDMLETKDDSHDDLHDLQIENDTRETSADDQVFHVPYAPDVLPESA